MQITIARNCWREEYSLQLGYANRDGRGEGIGPNLFFLLFEKDGEKGEERMGEGGSDWRN